MRHVVQPDDGLAVLVPRLRAVCAAVEPPGQWWVFHPRRAADSSVLDRGAEVLSFLLAAFAIDSAKGVLTAAVLRRL